MPRCVDCKYQGKYFTLAVPFPLETIKMMDKGGMNLEVPVQAILMTFEEDMRKAGFINKEDLSRKGMYCQAPGGGPTRDPIVLVQALVDQPCGFFSPKGSARP